MSTNNSKSRQPGVPLGDLPFTPRIVNPDKIREVVIFSGDGPIREAGASLQTQMPWVHVRTITNPATLVQFRSEYGLAFIMDDAALNIADTEMLRRNNKDAVICLLSRHKLVQTAPPAVARKEFPYTSKADLVFAVNKDEFLPERIMYSVVRLAEDHLNIKKRPGVRRFILLLVDDEPSWASYFLPILYKIIGQRAVVKLTRTYEETLAFLFGVNDESDIKANYRQRGFGDQVVCLITDIFFPKGESMDGQAGPDLIRLINRYYIRIPIIIASKAKEAAAMAHLGFVLPKGDPGSLEILKDYIHDRTGMGDFVVYDDDGHELHRLKNMGDMQRLLGEANEGTDRATQLRTILEAYGERDKFSTWFYMHSLPELGDRLRPQRHKGRHMIDVLRRSIEREIVRRAQTPLIIENTRVLNLEDLLGALRAAPPDRIQPLSNNDIISSWLDYQGYSELAEELRPVHGEGAELTAAIVSIVERWMAIYKRPQTD
ncbi:MAG: hypothetical protein NTW07_01805 [candidate division Zixibacteria bacterium]|nr:hypothetical protein [candidate division Zixibacteria bacterium]